MGRKRKKKRSKAGVIKRLLRKLGQVASLNAIGILSALLPPTDSPLENVHRRSPFPFASSCAKRKPRWT